MLVRNPEPFFVRCVLQAPLDLGAVPALALGTQSARGVPRVAGHFLALVEGRTPRGLPDRIAGGGHDGGRNTLSRSSSTAGACSIGRRCLQ